MLATPWTIFIIGKVSVRSDLCGQPADAEYAARLLREGADATIPTYGPRVAVA
jgi:hypothetical protein